MSHTRLQPWDFFTQEPQWKPKLKIMLENLADNFEAKSRLGRPGSNLVLFIGANRDNLKGKSEAFEMLHHGGGGISELVDRLAFALPKPSGDKAGPVQWKSVFLCAATTDIEGFERVFSQAETAIPAVHVGKGYSQTMLWGADHWPEYASKCVLDDAMLDRELYVGSDLWLPVDEKCRLVYESVRHGADWKTASQTHGMDYTIAQSRYRLRGLPAPVRTNDAPPGGNDQASVRVCKLITEGSSLADAALAVGVSTQTVSRYCKSQGMGTPGSLRKQSGTKEIAKEQTVVAHPSPSPEGAEDVHLKPLCLSDKEETQIWQSMDSSLNAAARQLLSRSGHMALVNGWDAAGTKLKLLLKKLTHSAGGNSGVGQPLTVSAKTALQEQQENQLTSAIAAKN